MMIKMIQINGSFGEGGGQILRTSLALSTITKKPVKVYNIRANRPIPGLRNQHLTVVNAFKTISGAEVEGANIGSMQLIFNPGKVKRGNFEFDITTAGSVTLLAQALIPALINTNNKLVFKGGTHVKWSPTYDYFENVFIPAIKKMGSNIKTNIERYGFYPHGGGKINVEIEPSTIKSYDFIGNENSENKEKVNGRIIISNLPEHIACRERNVIIQEFKDVEDVRIKKIDANDPGNSVTLWKGFVGASALGEKGVPAEKVAEKVCRRLKEQTGYGVDVNLADQLLIYMALAKGGNMYTKVISQHTKTNAYVIEQFLDVKFKFNKKNKGWVITV